MLRDCLGRSGHIDVSRPHVPLLFIGGQDDRIIPPALTRRNCEHYTDRGSVADFVEFPGRGHFICGAPGWVEVADRAHRWIEAHAEIGLVAGQRGATA